MSFETDSNGVEVHVKNLRDKLGILGVPARWSVRVRHGGWVTRIP